MGALHFLSTLNLLSIFTTVFFDFLLLFLILRAIVSFFPMISPAHPFVRFVTNITAPLLDPVQRLIPRLAIGMFDVSLTIAFIFVFWAIIMLEALMHSAIPAGW